MGNQTVIKKIGALLGMPAQVVRRQHYDLHRADFDETSCQFVSSRGIARACHPLVDLSRASATRIDHSAFRKLRAGDPVYLFTECIPEFVEAYLPRLEKPFTLVTGADDHSGSAKSIGASAIKTLLEHELVSRWFAQNAEIVHPKLTPIPIGVDYHVLAGNHRRPWRTFQSPRDQERDLFAVRARAPAIIERSCTAYSNWHFFLGRGDRQECFDRIDHACVFFEPVPVPRTQSWTNNARHLFTISPLGAGLDCHRTWEALLLGTIPIVHTSPLDGLYDGLPVCIVDDWAQVDAEFLQDRRNEMLERRYDFSTLLQRYWRELIISGDASRQDPLTLQEFLSRDGRAISPGVHSSGD